MSAIVLLAVCLALGILAARFAQLPRGTARAINFWVLYIALPALVLVQVPRLAFDSSLLYPALAPWSVMGGALVIFPFLGRRYGWSRGTVGALILACGLGNTSFMGLPMVEALRGREALGSAIIADQLGSFLALSTAGIAVAAHYSGQSARVTDLVRRVVTFPPFLALIGAVAVRGLGGWPAWGNDVLTRVGDTLTPLALFSVGLQFRLGDVAAHAPRVAFGLGWKMGLAPLLVVVTAWVLGLGGGSVTVAVLQCATAPMITAGLLAQQHDLDPPLANAVVSAGILLSLVTVPLWSWALG